MKRTIAAGAGLALCLSSVAARAQSDPPCITVREMHGLVAYFMPAVLEEVSTNCAARLPESSYLRAGLRPLQTSLDQGKEAAWPLARAAFFKISNAKDAKTMTSLSDRALRPLVDEVLGEKMKIPVDGQMCGEINDIAEALAPLSPDQTIHLLATIFNTVARKDRTVRSCPRQAG